MLLRSIRPALVCVVLMSTAMPIVAQEQVMPAPPPVSLRVPSERPDVLASERNVRLDVSVTLKGPKPVVKSLSIVTADGRGVSGRAGIEIPVANGPSGGPFEASFNYRPINVNVDATPNILSSGRVVVRLKMNFATVYLPESDRVPRASFGNGTTEINALVFESGKPLVVTQSVDGESGREYSVSVTATILK
jgi:hypothetical protein